MMMTASRQSVDIPTVQQHKRKTHGLKNDKVEQCLRSCGSEFQTWGPKQEKVRNPRVSVCIVGVSACGCPKKRVVYETECRRVAIQRGRQNQNHL